MSEAEKTSVVRLSENEIRPAELLAGQEAAFARDVERLHQRRAEFVAVDCPACGDTSQPSLAFEKYGFPFVRCVACKTIYMSPRPSVELMADYYSHSENYAYWAEHIFPASEATRREKIHRPWLAKVVAFCDQYRIERHTMVEIGPGFGTFSSLAIEQKAFRRVVAIEPTPELAEACRQRGVTVVEKRVEELAGEVVDADVVVAFEVIEHLFEPARLLSSLHAVLRPGGLLVLSCPNGQGFDVAVLGPKSKAVDAEHVNLFNPASLSRLVASCGFEVLEVTTPGRLDAEFVHDAIIKGEYDVSGQPFLQRVLVDEWERLGDDFQHFLAGHGLSSHMWLVARRQGQ